jgi:uncharacterized PurR-regulated membrane protein YhhQ (DUF165 family)
MTRRLLLVATLVATIVLANHVTATYGLLPVYPDSTYLVTAGTWFAALALVLRDGLHEATNGSLRWIFGAILLGGLASAVTSPAALAIASGVTFVVAEVADLSIYAPLRQRARALAIAASGVVGGAVDTVLFLHLAGFPLTWHSFLGQFIVKAGLSAVVAVAYLGVRATRRVAVPA